MTTKSSRAIGISLALPFLVFMGDAALAQTCEHGVTIQKTCPTSVRTCMGNDDCPGDTQCAEGVCDTGISTTTNCVISVTNAELDAIGGCEDDIQVNAAFDTLMFPTEPNQRVPAVGNLPILEVTGNAVCNAGPSLPCIIGIPGSTENGLPGTAQAGRVRFTSAWPLTGDQLADLLGETQLPDQATVTVQDLCNGPNGTAGCNQAPSNVQFTAATTVEPGCSVQPRPVSTFCETDDDLCTPEHCDGAGACVPNGPDVTCPGPQPPCEGGQHCEPASGLCVDNPDAEVSTFCETDDDLCSPEHCDGNGACVPNGPDVTCPGPQPPCEGGQHCEPASGSCVDNPDAEVSTSCEADEDLCTIDHCDGNGLCVKEMDVTCRDDLCEVCIPATGMCVVDDTDPRCQERIGCRITGGGITSTGDTDPGKKAQIQRATFGGQVGAPCGCIGCFDDLDHVQGQWTHVRHKGNGRLRAPYFASLVCGCDGVFDGNLCNPDDREPGPEPRPAPANMACWTGAGTFKRQEAVFRVEVEDRGEPGAGKNDGGTTDVYRMRIWVVDEALESSADLLEDICCTNAEPLGRDPDVDDGGDLIKGNIQIHPQTPLSSDGICPPPDGTCQD